MKANRAAPVRSAATLVAHEVLESRRLLAASPLISGKSVEANISEVGQVDQYTITVQPNQRYMIAAVGKTSGGSSFSVKGQIVPPSGSDESTTTFTGNIGRALDGGSGPQTYTIRIFDDGSNATGGYRLTVFTSNGAQDDDDANDFSDTTDNTSANSGQRSAATADVGDLDVWRLDVKQRQSLTVTVVENDEDSPISPEVWLLDASGRLVAHQTNEVGLRLAATAAESGAYYAVVADQGSNSPGVYGIAFTRVPGQQYTGDPDTGPLSPNVTRSGDLPAGDADVFTVYLKPGQDISVTVSRKADSSLDPRVILYDPSGATVASNGGNGQPSGTAATSVKADLGGTYYVAVFDDESNDGGTYDIRYTLTGDGDGTSPSAGRVAIETGSSADTIVARRRNADGIDALEFTVNGKTTRYYAPEVEQVAIYSGGGSDRIILTESNIRTYVSAGSGDDTVYGTSGNDSLTGGAGRNRLYGGGGDDRLNGSGGRDFLFGEDGNDRLYGQGGNDRLDGGGNSDRLFGGDGNDELYGGNGIDHLYGNNGDDILIGGRDTDYLRADAGNDRFRSMDDTRDQLFGGDGTDRIDGNDFDKNLDEFPLNDVEVIPS